MVVLVPDEAREVLPAAVAEVRRHLAAVERACSRFHEGSELVDINRAQRQSTVAGSPGAEYPVSSLLAAHLQAALDAAAATDGAVVPTLGRALCAIGYDRSAGRRGFSVNPDPAPDTSSGPVPVQVHRHDHWRDVVVTVPPPGAVPDDSASRVARLFLPAGVELDLGATTKAMAADEAARLAHRATTTPVLVSLGGDCAAMGTPEGRAWPVTVAEVPGEPGSHVLMADGGMATSTVRLRRWHQGDIARHHLVDPLTGLPASGRWRTATVAAPGCLQANAASTATLVRRSDPVAWLSGLGLPARLVDREGLVLRLGGWPADTEVAA